MYFINESMLGPDATKSEAIRMVELLEEMGYRAIYGEEHRNNRPISSSDWDECLLIISNERSKKDANHVV